ncbi:O-antigen ligase family protein [Candidatus Parcubacteria bacterium]|nr:O-antigen ligase family protein [Candidatus Parcubacteria bacterium]
MAIGILLLISFVKKGASKIFIYPLGAIFIFSLFLTFSRSAWLGLVAVLIYYSFKNFDNKDIRKFFIFSILSIASLSFIFWPFVTSRVKSEGYLESKSNIERVASWREGLELWTQNPLFGIGIGNYTIGLPKPYGQPSHNIFLMVLAELGAVGFLLYLALWRKLWKSGLHSVLILFFIIGLFDHYLWTLYSGQMIFWVGLAFFQEN